MSSYKFPLLHQVSVTYRDKVAFVCDYMLMHMRWKSVVHCYQVMVAMLVNFPLLEFLQGNRGSTIICAKRTLSTVSFGRLSTTVYICLFLSLLFTFTAVWLNRFSFFQGLSDEAANVVYQMKRATSVGQKEEKAAMLESWAESGLNVRTVVINMTNSRGISNGIFYVILVSSWQSLLTSVTKLWSLQATVFI